jgi:outer membrane protein assembly factor BamB
MMVLGQDVAFGAEVYASWSRETVFRPGAQAYRLICLPTRPTVEDRRAKAAVGKRRPQGVRPLWQQTLPMRVTAMIRAADTVFVGGSPDAIDPQDPHGAWQGRQGGRLAAFAADTGQLLAEYPLPAPPVWDAMAAAGGRLYLSLTDGSVLCLE